MNERGRVRERYTCQLLAAPVERGERLAREHARERGLEPQIVDYLENPPSQETLKELQTLLGCSVMAMIRPGEAPYREMNLAQADDAQLLQAMVDHPILLQRPIVVNNGRAVIGRPPEQVLEIL